ncbi:MAG: hypothetical protein IKK99_05090 [Oscillospiraceae bacterium]|nr:hypothetical protein [Oscillospiraceae bacterium]
MKLTQVKQLLDDNKINYTVSKVDNRGDFYRRKGFKDTKVSHSFTLLTIPNPNHHLGIELIFISDNENPEFRDMLFGGFEYELFLSSDEWNKEFLVKEVNDILAGNIYIVTGWNDKTAKWIFDSRYVDTDEEWEENMDEYHRDLEKIHAPKTRLEKLKGKTMKYEIYNWTNYECVIK